MVEEKTYSNEYVNKSDKASDSDTHGLTLYEIDQIEKKLVDLMDDGVFIAQDYHFIYANPALTSMLDYQPGEFIGSEFETVVAPEYLDIWLARYNLRIGEGPEPPGRYELQFLCKDGNKRIWLELQAKRIQYNGRLAMLGVVRDISEFKKMQANLELLSQTDDLTDLVNRHRLIDLLTLSITSAFRRKEKLAVMYLDLDGFKQVNDTLGHAAGDHLLKQAAARIHGLVRAIDIVGRYGGDEFVIVLKEIKTFEDSKNVARKVIEQLSLPYWYENNKIEVSASIGISHYPDNGDNYEILLKHADKAMYQAKRSGIHRYRICEIDNND